MNYFSLIIYVRHFKKKIMALIFPVLWSSEYFCRLLQIKLFCVLSMDLTHSFLRPASGHSFGPWPNNSTVQAAPGRSDILKPSANPEKVRRSQIQPWTPGSHPQRRLWKSKDNCRRDHGRGEACGGSVKITECEYSLPGLLRQNTPFMSNLHQIIIQAYLTIIY